MSLYARDAKQLQNSVHCFHWPNFYYCCTVQVAKCLSALSCLSYSDQSSSDSNYRLQRGEGSLLIAPFVSFLICVGAFFVVCHQLSRPRRHCSSSLDSIHHTSYCTTESYCKCQSHSRLIMHQQALKNLGYLQLHPVHSKEKDNATWSD